MRGRVSLGLGLELLPGRLVRLSNHELSVRIDHDARRRLGFTAVGVLAQSCCLIHRLEERSRNARGSLDAWAVIILWVVVGWA